MNRFAIVLFASLFLPCIAVAFGNLPPRPTAIVNVYNNAGITVTSLEERRENTILDEGGFDTLTPIGFNQTQFARDEIYRNMSVYFILGHLQNDQLLGKCKFQFYLDGSTNDIRQTKTTITCSGDIKETVSRYYVGNNVEFFDVIVATK